MSKAVFICILFFLPFSLIAQVEIEAFNGGYLQIIEKEFTTLPQGELVITTALGSIEIKARQDNNVFFRVEKSIQKAEKEEAAEIFKSFTVESINDSDYVEIEGKFSEGEYFEGFRVKYIVNVPSQFNVDVQTTGGKVILRGIGGNALIETSGSNIEADIIGGETRLSSTGGDISAGIIRKNADIKCIGGTISLGDIGGTLFCESAGGDIRIGKVTGEVVVSSAGGSVEIGGSEQKITAQTMGGDIKVGKSLGPVKLVTSAGKITVEGARKYADVRTMGGNIELKNIEGYVLASSSGGELSVEIIASDLPAGNVSELKAVGGDVFLYVLPELSAEITAEVKYSRNIWGGFNIHSDFPITSSRGGQDVNQTVRDREMEILRASCILNNGGGKIRIEASEGDVYIKQYKK